MTNDLDQKVVVVTGGTSGIGRATAELLTHGGARVVLFGRRKHLIDEVSAALGDLATGVVVNVGDPSSVRDAFALVKERYGRLDALLNVAGAMQLKKLECSRDDDIASIVSTNYLGPMYTTREAIPLLRASGGGDIINVSSEATLFDFPFMSLYTSTKAGLEAFTQTIANELRPDRIRVGLVVVGHTDTPIPSTIDPVDREAAVPTLQSAGFFDRTGGAMDPMWVAETICFALCRPRGQIMNVFHARSFA